MPLHTEAARLIRELGEGSRPWGVPVFVVGEFLRVVTHPGVFTHPTSMSQAFRALHALMDAPTSRLLTPGERYLRILADTITGARARGNLIYDAQIVAVCVEHGVTTIVSEDRDLRRFDEITVRGIAHKRRR